MSKKNSSNFYALSKISLKITRWVGTPQSIILHTLLFAGCFLLPFFGFNAEDILLILTTAVSLEAIYLAIFIQISVNRASQSLEDVEDDIEEIQEDVRELGEDIEDIQEEEDQDKQAKATLAKIEDGLQKLLSEVESLKH